MYWLSLALSDKSPREDRGFPIGRQPQSCSSVSPQLRDVVICTLIVYLRKCREMKVL